MEGVAANLSSCALPEGEKVNKESSSAARASVEEIDARILHQVSRNA